MVNVGTKYDEMIIRYLIPSSENLSHRQLGHMHCTQLVFMCVLALHKMLWQNKAEDELVCIWPLGRRS